MAPRKKFTREEMVDAAVRVVRGKGIDSLTAKALAQELGVSTQPVFTCFHTIEEAKQEVYKSAEQLYDKYVNEGLAMPLPFYGFGIQYYRFAKEEPEFYRMLFLTTSGDNYSRAFTYMRHSQNLVRDSIMKTYNMDSITADRYCRDMWFVIHSLATLEVTGGCPYSEEEISQILTGFSLSMCKAIKEIPGFVENNYNRDEIFTKLVKING